MNWDQFQDNGELTLTGDMTEDINTALAALAGCVCESIDPIASCGLTLGSEFVEIGVDYSGCEDGDCGECGQAWVRVTNGYPTNSVGSHLLEVNSACSTMWGMDIEVGVIRCIEMPDKGEAIPQSTLIEATNQQMKDMVATRNAILCCPHFPDYVLDTWKPYGPEGMQVGGVWTLSVMI